MLARKHRLCYLRIDPGLAKTHKNSTSEISPLCSGLSAAMEQMSVYNTRTAEFSRYPSPKLRSWCHVEIFAAFRIKQARRVKTTFLLSYSRLPLPYRLNHRNIRTEQVYEGGSPLCAVTPLNYVSPFIASLFKRISSRVCICI